jgi:hypothetical protein
MTDTPQPVDYQLARQAAHTSLLNVTPRGDDQIHIVDFFRSTSEKTTSIDDLMLRLLEVMTADVIAKRSVTNNANLFLAIRQLLTAYQVPVHRANGFPVIRGVIDALFEGDPAQLQAAVSTWKNSRSQPMTGHKAPASPQIQNPRCDISRIARAVSNRFPLSQQFSGKMGESPSFAEICHQFMDKSDELELTGPQQVTFLV